MSDIHFVNDLTLEALGPGARYAILGLRASARGAHQCCKIRLTFDHAFGADGDQAREQLFSLAHGLGHEGRRKIALALPASNKITSDELCFLAALSAAQCGCEDDVSAHMGWLFSGPHSEASEHALRCTAALFYLHGVRVETPTLTRPILHKPITKRPVNYFGTA